jgi:hypothetical protein
MLLAQYWRRHSSHPLPSHLSIGQPWTVTPYVVQGRGESSDMWVQAVTLSWY